MIPPPPVDVCPVAMQELSGLTSDGKQFFAVSDSDNGTLRIQVMGRDCVVTRTITAPVDPYDVEDLAMTPDGTLWASDTGDNNKSRSTVALHKVSPSGAVERYRVTYPDGKHDAEALFIDKSGTPYIVTKEPLGSALVYRPTAPLRTDISVPLEQVARVSLSTTDTPGGPLEGTLDSRLVTGAAAMSDGSVIALRTYTDAYLYPVPDGDPKDAIVKALSGDPVRVPLPNEPQGEAIAFDPDGTLLSASEGAGTPIRAVAGAAALAQPPAPTTTAPPPAADQPQSSAPADSSSSSWQNWPLALTLGGLVLIAALVIGLRFRRRA
ncbi:esterase-like activity of phytase family protein [Lentzea sp. NEAU-D13]|uniref:Esterase-like activity of phytase family protein n=1 Tax=Lentzea alba TaxID=2714351 RepID=A0A7C9VUU1_9PSEU|nr:esterase-like activity of phytase family protein [Lentzea alba]